MSDAAWPDGRWHYRRSLASRVAVLTTVALGVSIAVMALTAFVVMRQQLMSSLDQSLLNRAHKATATTTLSEITARGAPAWMLGAADVRIIFISAEGRAMTGDDIPNFTLGQPEYDVATGQRESAVRTLVTAEGERFRVATVQANSGHALILAQPLAPNDRTLEKLSGVLFVFGALGVLAALLAGWLVARSGLRPVRRLTSSVEHIAVTEDLTPLRVEGDDEVARLATAFNQMLLALGASRDRQRRLVADASHELRTPLTSLRTNLDLLRQAEGNDGLPARGAPGAARRRARADRGAQRAGRRPGRARARRADDPRGRRGRPRRGRRAGRDARTPSRPRRRPSTSTSTRGPSSATPAASSAR